MDSKLVQKLIALILIGVGLYLTIHWPGLLIAGGIAMLFLP